MSQPMENPDAYIRSVNSRLFAEEIADLWSIEPSWFDLGLIAAALAKLCRFNGHCPRFYSVAQHCVAVSLHAALDGPGLGLWGLMHDAAEYWIGDISRPLKSRLMVAGDGCTVNDIERLESRILHQTAFRFALPWPMPPAVTLADDALLAYEAEVFFKYPDQWSRSFRCWTPEEAEERFLKRYDELVFLRTGLAEGLDGK